MLGAQANKAGNRLSAFCLRPPFSRNILSLAYLPI
jgi:hypothetical protein